MFNADTSLPLKTRIQSIAYDEWIRPGAFPILERCLKETIRLRVGTPLHRLNHTDKDIQMGSVIVPPGTIASFHTSFVHHNVFQTVSEVMLKSALALASVRYALATMTAIPTNGTAYIMQDGRTTRCVTLGAAPALNYAKIGMEVCTGSTDQQWKAVSTIADGIHFAFSSVAAPLTYLSYVSAEIPNSGGQASLYQQSMGHPEPLEFLLQPAPTANMSILYFSNGPGGVLTANTPFSAAILANQPSPLMMEIITLNSFTFNPSEPSQWWGFTPVATTAS
ncbi:hypothetical protein C8F04DRAFT_1396609 [Mycena alexandri]|uniref:Uncharacterized protein n=1 Tax=Mycena alexandri TaxID=1745969 RepID=A0AAD6SVK1_9AGAR|nr:hypothetical protein C8F04DRAFT_1396609 [Mycena alexandri]